MKQKIMVAYATTHGSTAEIADAIAQVLREKGLETYVSSIRLVRNLDGYSGVVLGAPLYMFRWAGDAFKFLRGHQKAIQSGIPVAVFAGGPFGETKPEVWHEVRANLDKEITKEAWFKPASVLIVGGKFDPTGLRFPYNLIPAMKQQPASDLRDWDEIRDWANSLAEQFSA